MDLQLRASDTRWNDCSPEVASLQLANSITSPFRRLPLSFTGLCLYSSTHQSFFWNDNDLQYVLESCQENIFLILDNFWYQETTKSLLKQFLDTGFPQWLSGKESVCKAGDTGDEGLIIVGGQGNPLQYCGLENPMDRGTWWATVHEATKSQTWRTQKAHVGFCRVPRTRAVSHTSFPLLFLW